ncbi:MAG: RNase adapter RapZ [Candidatus Velthaea sp.]
MMRRLVIVTGLSGAGKSQAMKSFEDLGFACLDNLPPVLSPQFVALVERTSIDRAAIALDVRTCGPFGDALATIDALAASGEHPELLFLDADAQTLVRRYSETRRRHPFGDRAKHLTDAIAAEREALAPLRDRADHVWDTSRLTQGMLKERIENAFSSGEARMQIAIVAFGFKYGVPLDCDLVFDVRFLPNPNYDPALKPLTGNDRAVADFLEALPDTEAFLAHMLDMIDFLLPRYRREGKSQLTIGIGCTGGRHRSVYLARRLEAHLKRDDEAAVTVEERDLRR